MASTTVHTVNARDDVFLEAIRHHLGLNSAQTFSLIRGMYTQLNDVLLAKGIVYQELKSGLVPSTTRHEVALLFDSLQIDDAWYGRRVFEHVIPLFGRQSTHSVLAGDFLGESLDQYELRRELRRSLIAARPLNDKNSRQYFVVYVNNVSPSTVDLWHRTLGEFTPYAGYVDMTYSSLLKVLFSTMLPKAFLLHRGVALVTHEDDRNNDENTNPALHPFTESGLGYKSLQSLFFGVFLSYKIERPVLPGFENDTSSR